MWRHLRLLRFLRLFQAPLYIQCMKPLNHHKLWLSVNSEALWTSRPRPEFETSTHRPRNQSTNQPATGGHTWSFDFGVIDYLSKITWRVIKKLYESDIYESYIYRYIFHPVITLSTKDKHLLSRDLAVKVAFEMWKWIVFIQSYVTANRI